MARRPAAQRWLWSSGLARTEQPPAQCASPCGLKLGGLPGGRVRPPHIKSVTKFTFQVPGFRKLLPTLSDSTSAPLFSVSLAELVAAGHQPPRRPQHLVASLSARHGVRAARRALLQRLRQPGSLRERPPFGLSLGHTSIVTRLYYTAVGRGSGMSTSLQPQRPLNALATQAPVDHAALG